MLHIRMAHTDELSALSELCLRSKALEHYDQATRDIYEYELTLVPADLTTTQIGVAELLDNLVGVAQVEVVHFQAKLLKLYVDRKNLHRGIGRALFDWACDEAKRLGATQLFIEADPDALPFFRQMGAIVAGVAPSRSTPGKILPLLVYDLSTKRLSAIKSRLQGLVGHLRKGPVVSAVEDATELVIYAAMAAVGPRDLRPRGLRLSDARAPLSPRFHQKLHRA